MTSLLLPTPQEVDRFASPVFIPLPFPRVYAWLLSHVPLFATPWTIARQAPLPMGSSSLEYWSGLPFPPPGDLRDPGMEPASPASPTLAGGFFTSEPPGKQIIITTD